MPRFALPLLLGILASSALGAQQAPPPPLPPLPAALPRTHAPQPTKGAISAADLKTRLYIYADDSMMGREVGTLGNVKATDYIAAEAKRMGLKPAGENGTYFQTVPLTEQALGPTTHFAVNDTTFVLGTDWLPANRAAADGKVIEIVYGGRIGDLAQLTPAQMAGKAVVFSPPTEDAVRSGRTMRPSAVGAAAVILLALDQVPLPVRAGVLKTRVMRTADVQPIPTNAVPVIYMTESAGAKLFTTPMSGLALGAAGKPTRLTIATTELPARYPGRNVVALITGSDPKLRNQYVAVGAHNDHIGMRSAPLDHDSVRAYNHVALISGADSRPIEPTADQWTSINGTIAQLRAQNPARADSIYNGADDDGSGTVSVLEMAEYFQSMKNKPKRSLLFVWHTGEEKGLWGSEYFTDHPTVPRDSIVAQLNIDMIGRGDTTDIAGGNPYYLQLIGSRRLSTELGDLIEHLNTADKHNMRFDYSYDADGHPAQIYCRSDHYSYARYGIPITFFTTGLHPDYHQLTDEPQYIDYDHMARVASFVGDVAAHLANQPRRPVVDKPKPDPTAACHQ